MADEKNMKLSIPGEWAVEKVLSPVLGSIGDDINSLYAISKKGASKIILKAFNKITNNLYAAQKFIAIISIRNAKFLHPNLPNN